MSDFCYILSHWWDIWYPEEKIKFRRKLSILDRKAEIGRFRIVTNQETLKSDQTRYFWDLFTAVSTLLAQLSPAAMNSARFDIKIKRIQSKMNTSLIFRKS